LHDEPKSRAAFKSLPSVPGVTFAETAKPVASAPAVPAKPSAAIGTRVALVIGNSAYKHAPRLANPENDARAVAEALKGLHFVDVRLRFNLDRQALLDELKSFGDAARKSDWAMLYFAGHGIQSDKKNYVLPVDARLAAEEHLTYEAVTDDNMLGGVTGARKLSLVVLDACRDNPFITTMARRKDATRSMSRGLSRIDPGQGTLVAYSARDNTVALDGDGDMSPFASALVTHMRDPKLEIGRLFRRIREAVMRSTNGQQEPVYYSALPDEDLYFNPQ
jgi:uncharacterized caspase-like protein